MLVLWVMRSRDLLIKLWLNFYLYFRLNRHSKFEGRFNAAFSIDFVVDGRP